MAVRQPTAVATSAGWGNAAPVVSVVIATHDRSGFLAELLDSVAAQVDAPGFEVVIADDGSTDATWATLESLVESSPLPIKALQLPACGGPSVPRNTAVAASRGQVVAFTDDDCLPEPGWLAAITPAAFAGHIVQGATRPLSAGRVSPWDRTISVSEDTGLWESCNVALPRAVFDAVGGFPVLDLLPVAGRGFGEDAVLGVRAERLAGGEWAPLAVVRHRWLIGSYRTHLEAMRRLAAMPGLVAQAPEIRSRAYLSLFRSRRSASCDLAIVAVGAAVATRRGVPLVATLPWIRLVARAARGRWGRPSPARMVQEAAADLVGAAALAKGSLKARTPLL